MAKFDNEDILATQVRALEAQLRSLHTDTLDKFAIAALQSNHDWGNMGYGYSDVAADCYDMAEAMMKERNKRMKQHAKAL